MKAKFTRINFRHPSFWWDLISVRHNNRTKRFEAIKFKQVERLLSSKFRSLFQ